MSKKWICFVSTRLLHRHMNIMFCYHQYSFLTQLTIDACCLVSRKIITFPKSNNITFLVDDKSMTDMEFDIRQKKLSTFCFCLFSDLITLKGRLELGVGGGVIVSVSSSDRSFLCFDFLFLSLPFIRSLVSIGFHKFHCLQGSQGWLVLFCSFARFTISSKVSRSVPTSLDNLVKIQSV